MAAPFSIDWDKFQDSFYSFLKHVIIVSKDVGRVHLEMYDAQKYFFDEVFDGLREDKHWQVCGKGRQVGICLDPKTRVLTADLRWVHIGELDVGQEIISVDEHSEGPRCGRKMRLGIVEAVVRVRRESYRIGFDDGRSLICTGAHPWLSRKNDTQWYWRSIEKPDQSRDLNQRRGVGVLEVGTKIRWATRAPWDEPTAEDGWFGGMLDGEGSISNKDRSGVQISVAQRRGDVWDRLIRYVEDRGYHYGIQEDTNPERTSKFGKNPVPHLELRRLDEAFRIIGQARPTRFLKRRFWEDREMPGKRNGDRVGFATITSIEPAGVRDLVDLQTSRGTYIAEGFVSHNTTACLLFDVFYAGSVPDVQGAIVFDEDGNKEKFRKILGDMMDTLPPSHALKLAKGGNNRQGLVFQNGNMLDYLTAGRKKGSGSLGRSRAYNFCHATEVSGYGDPEAFEAFRDTLSNVFPARLYLFESTAAGYNLFYDLWDEAENDDIDKKTIFVSWWRKATYSYARGTALFKRYGWPELSKEEQEASATVERDYGHKISREQWAWYRHRADPAARQDVDPEATERREIITVEHPHFPEQMFRSTGSPFIPGQYLTPAMARAQKIAFKGYRYHLGDSVMAIRIDQTNFLNRVHLRVWQEPVPGATYIVAGDPAYGLSDDGDGFAAQVVRCYADKVVQVAEFCDRNVTPFQFAWVLLHLCGWYGNCRFIIELNGPGEAVWTELRNLKRQTEDGNLAPPRQRPDDPSPEELEAESGIRNTYALVRQFLFRRSDSLSGGGQAYQMRTSQDAKFTFMTQFADRFMLGEFEVNSIPCLNEMRALKRDGRWIAAEGRAKDDRPLALGLATRAYIDSERQGLISRGETYDVAQARAAAGGDNLVASYMSSIVASHVQSRRRARDRAMNKRGWQW